MQKNRKKTICTIGLTCLIFFIAGCGSQDEMPTEPVTVKSFKIEKTDKPEVKQVDELTSADKPSEVIDNSTASPEVEKSIQVTEGMDNSEEKSPTSEDSHLGDNTVQERSLSDVGEGEALPVKAEAPPIAKESVDVDIKKTDPKFVGSAVGALPDIELDDLDDSKKSTGYDPKGRIDPFEPLFQAKEDAVVEESSKGKYQTIRDSRKGKLTPLEKLDLSQLKLTAIILSPNRNIAMVKESTGKGHVIKKGTYIGINSGRVVEINKNIVIIEEEVEDYLGKIRVQKRELKLQKPLGER